MFVYDLIKFPIWKNDGKAIVNLNEVQRKAIEEFLLEIEKGNIKFLKNPCLCGNKNASLDVIIAEKDRYGIPCENVLCKKCGLIRLKERMDDKSTGIFYRDFYRRIYEGKEVANEEFFNKQTQRGEIFLKLFTQYVDDKIENVFEIGCGAGGVVYPFKKIAKNISGCDYGEKYLEYGKRKGLNLYFGGINKEYTPKESQDLIILSHVMEHFNNPLEEMKKIIEFVKPGKYLLIEVPGIFYMAKTYYFNPLLYFQNAHVHNYYYYYLKVFFEKLGLEIIFGNERCTFILKKPQNWQKPRRSLIIYDEQFEVWVKKVEKQLKKAYLQHIFKANPYYWRAEIIRILDSLGIKEVIKKTLGK